MAPVSSPNRVRASKRLLARAGLVLLAAMAHSLFAAPLSVTAVRHWSLGEATRVVIEVSDEFQYASERLPAPDRIFFDIRNARHTFPGTGVHSIQVGDAFLKQIRVAQTQLTVTRIVLDIEPGVDFSASQLANPARLIIELRKRGAPVTAPLQVEMPPPAPAPAPRKVFTPPAPRPAVAPKPILITAVPPALRPLSYFPDDAKLPEPAKTSLYRARKRVESAGAKVPGGAQPPAPVPAARNDELPKATPAEQADSAVAARRDARGGRSMTRALGLKIGKVVIDPGHGGHDTGTIGPKGNTEKALVLDVALRLGELVEEKLGAQVVFTRSDDTYVTLERRTAIANAEKADLFISIHANSSPIRTTSGVETYYLNFTTSKDSLDVAARENASSKKSVHELKDLLQRIALSDKIEESRELARRVQETQHALALKTTPGLFNRGVKKAPFVVLIGAGMPSILTEIGFISNPKDEAAFGKADQRQKVAEAIFKGISQYCESLSHFQVARKGAKE